MTSLPLHDTSVTLLRLDLPDPVNGGNKSFKLRYNIEAMRTQGLKRLLTFGGAFSNHIAAVAAAGKRHGFETTGIIRGDELNARANAVLEFASSCGMQLVFVSREDYRRRNDPAFCEQLLQRHGPAYLIPEGGSNALAVKGCTEILPPEAADYDVIVCPVGTGATLAGIIASAKPHQHVVGIAVLNNAAARGLVSLHLNNHRVAASWEIAHDYTLGGYAKTNSALDAFIATMKNEHDLPLDHVYSGKALFALHRMTEENKFPGKRILFVHTGGYGFVTA